MSKKIAIYGAVEAKAPVFQRYWKRRKDGILQRYWKKTTRMKKVKRKDVRYEFSGKGKDLYKAILKAIGTVPKGFIDVPAKEFLRHPERYGHEGIWIEREIESK